MRRVIGLLAVVVTAAGLAACAPATTDRAATLPPTQAAATPRATEAGFVTGLDIPWAVGGKRTTGEGRTVFELGEWPTFPVSAVRLWDTRTTWLNLEPRDGLWDFSALDAHLAKAHAHGVDDVLLVLAGTPRWAAQRVSPDDAPWLGPGSASPPTDLADWTSFVTEVASRYRGQLSYEIGNEPNFVTFWNGTPAEYAGFVSAAAKAIVTADPDAHVIAGGPALRRLSDLPAIDEWLAGLAGDPNIDAFSVHLYPSAGTTVEQARDLLDRARAALRSLTDKPAWVTEMNVDEGGTLPPEEQARWVTALPQAVESTGFARAYWYAWTRFLPDGLIPLSPGTSGARVLAEAAAR